MNNELLTVCKNYNSIMECEFLDEDTFSKKLVEYYKEFILKTDFNNPKSIEKTKTLDEAVHKYIEDYDFCKRLKNTIDVSAIMVDDFSYLNEFMDYLVQFSYTYEKNKEKVVVQTKWI